MEKTFKIKKSKINYDFIKYPIDIETNTQSIEVFYKGSTVMLISKNRNTNKISIDIRYYSYPDHFGKIIDHCISHLDTPETYINPLEIYEYIEVSSIKMRLKSYIRTDVNEVILKADNIIMSTTDNKEISETDLEYVIATYKRNDNLLSIGTGIKMISDDNTIEINCINKIIWNFVREIMKEGDKALISEEIVINIDDL